MGRPKGSKNKPGQGSAIARTHCATCGKPLPGPALKAVMLHLRNVLAALNVEPPKDTSGEIIESSRRWFRATQLGTTRAQLALLLEEEARICFGHDKRAREPRQKRVRAEPDATPKAPERKLRAVRDP